MYKIVFIWSLKAKKEKKRKKWMNKNSVVLNKISECIERKGEICTLSSAFLFYKSYNLFLLPFLSTCHPIIIALNLWNTTKHERNRKKEICALHFRRHCPLFVVVDQNMTAHNARLTCFFFLFLVLKKLNHSTALQQTINNGNIYCIVYRDTIQIIKYKCASRSSSSYDRNAKNKKKKEWMPLHPNIHQF